MSQRQRAPGIAKPVKKKDEHTIKVPRAKVQDKVLLLNQIQEQFTIGCCQGKQHQSGQ